MLIYAFDQNPDSILMPVFDVILVLNLHEMPLQRLNNCLLKQFLIGMCVFLVWFWTINDVKCIIL